MLRITVQDDQQGVAFKLEGKLAHEWVTEAEKAWTEFSALPQRGRVVVDLCGVTFVDDAGRELLSRMHAFGAKLMGNGPMTSALIEEICRAAQSRAPRWMRGVVSLLLVLLVSAVPRKDASFEFARGMATGDLLLAIHRWIFALQGYVTHICKGLSR